MRPFTIAEANLAINLFNIDRLKFIERAPVKHQCSGDYFYGQSDGLELGIQAIEGAYGAALREILSPGYSLSEPHRALLRRFWLFQHLRTEAASRRSVEMANATDAVIGDESNNFRLGIKQAVQIAMGTFSRHIDAADDLKICLFRNKTRTPFVTSDDPAQLTNRWHLEIKRSTAQSFGLTSAGALLLLPLSPSVLCLGYDGDVYSIPHDSGWVQIHRDADVCAFNQHQFLNCRANIFVRDAEDAPLVHRAFSAVASFRPKARHKLRYAVVEGREGNFTRFREVDRANLENHEEALVHSQVIHARPNAWPRQILFRTKGGAYTDGSAAGYVRRATALKEQHRAFRKEITP